MKTMNGHANYRNSRAMYLSTTDVRSDSGLTNQWIDSTTTAARKRMLGNPSLSRSMIHLGPTSAHDNNAYYRQQQPQLYPAQRQHQYQSAISRDAEFNTGRAYSTLRPDLSGYDDNISVFSESAVPVRNVGARRPGRSRRSRDMTSSTASLVQPLNGFEPQSTEVSAIDPKLKAAQKAGNLYHISVNLNPATRASQPPVVTMTSAEELLTSRESRASSRLDLTSTGQWPVATNEPAKPQKTVVDVRYSDLTTLSDNRRSRTSLRTPLSVSTLDLSAPPAVTRRPRSSSTGPALSRSSTRDEGYVIRSVRSTAEENPMKMSRPSIDPVGFDVELTTDELTRPVIQTTSVNHRHTTADTEEQLLTMTTNQTLTLDYQPAEYQHTTVTERTTVSNQQSVSHRPNKQKPRRRSPDEVVGVEPTRRKPGRQSPDEVDGVEPTRRKPRRQSPDEVVGVEPTRRKPRRQSPEQRGEGQPTRSPGKLPDDEEEDDNAKKTGVNKTERKLEPTMSDKGTQVTVNTKSSGTQQATAKQLPRQSTTGTQVGVTTRNQSTGSDDMANDKWRQSSKAVQASVTTRNQLVGGGTQTKNTSNSTSKAVQATVQTKPAVDHSTSMIPDDIMQMVPEANVTQTAFRPLRTTKPPVFDGINFKPVEPVSTDNRLYAPRQDKPTQNGQGQSPRPRGSSVVSELSQNGQGPGRRSITPRAIDENSNGLLHPDYARQPDRKSPAPSSRKSSLNYDSELINYASGQNHDGPSDETDGPITVSTTALTQAQAPRTFDTTDGPRRQIQVPVTIKGRRRRSDVLTVPASNGETIPKHFGYEGSRSQYVDRLMRGAPLGSIVQTEHTEKQEEEIFGPLPGAGLSQRPTDDDDLSSDTMLNFDTVSEKVDLTVADGKAQLTVKVRCERIVPVRGGVADLFKKTSVIVTRVIEVDLSVTTERRELYDQIVTSQRSSSTGTLSTHDTFDLYKTFMELADADQRAGHRHQQEIYIDEQVDEKSMLDLQFTQTTSGNSRTSLQNDFRQVDGYLPDVESIELRSRAHERPIETRTAINNRQLQKLQKYVH